MDSIVPAAVLSVSSLVNNLLSSVRTTKELAKQSGDSELKEQIVDLFGAILDVKERVLELDQENRVLRAQLDEKASVERDVNTEAFYKKGEIDPLCPKCYQGPNHEVVYLQQQSDGSGWCVVCVNRYKYAKRSV